MSRYLLSIGLPFEQWIRHIAAHAEGTSNADAFLDKAMLELANLSWVTGIVWHSNGEEEAIGETSQHTSTFNFSDIKLTLYSRWPFRPVMYLHVQLLTQILGEFYDAKRREEAITQTTYMRSLYETGSRLTHDIKNILQSLGTLTSASKQVRNEADEARLLSLIKLQLPRLNQRLASTLSKLEEPSLERKQQAKVTKWWHTFMETNLHEAVIFDSPTQFPNVDVDIDVLDSVVDNLLQNAVEKAKHEGELVIQVSLPPTNHFCVEVSDNGSPMSKQTAEQLFKSHVPSEHGLGVGLYHAAQQAEQAGYTLSLINNEQGHVRFRLSKQ